MVSGMFIIMREEKSAAISNKEESFLSLCLWLSLSLLPFSSLVSSETREEIEMKESEA